MHIEDSRQYEGLLFVGDPHLASRVPGFRKDDYPRVALEKLLWVMQYARDEKLKPALLGDLFEFPQANANWLMSELLAGFRGTRSIAIYGNHDCAGNQLDENDSLTVLSQGDLRLLKPEDIWVGEINGQTVCIGGTSWGRKLPSDLEFLGDSIPQDSLVFWMTHHDVMPEEDNVFGKIQPHEISGIAAIINGHIHKRQEVVRHGETTWITPGNITRTKRSDAIRQHVPSVLRIHIKDGKWEPEWVEVPHMPFEEVFHEAIVEQGVGEDLSQFVQGLGEVRARRTESAAGLEAFLVENIKQYEEPVQKEILSLFEEVKEGELQTQD